MRGIKRPKNKKKILTFFPKFIRGCLASFFFKYLVQTCSDFFAPKSYTTWFNKFFFSFQNETKTERMIDSKKKFVKMLFDSSVKIYCVFALERSQTKLNNFRARSF